MARNVSDHLVARLSAWGVRRVYGYPGDGINGLMGAMNRMREKMQFVQTRHVELAAFMATAHAKFGGDIGVCMATSGPGAIHLLNGLYDAKADHQPVLAIVGQQQPAALGGDYQQEVDLASLLQGLRARVRADDRRARAGAARERSRNPHRPRSTHRDVRDRAERRAGA